MTCKLACGDVIWGPRAASQPRPNFCRSSLSGLQLLCTLHGSRRCRQQPEEVSMHPQVYGALGGTTSTVGLGDILFRGVHVTGFWCAHLCLQSAPYICGHGCSSASPVRRHSGHMMMHSCGSYRLLDAGKGRLCTCRLARWLTELGDKKAEVLSSCMDLMARGIIVPTVGVLHDHIARASRSLPGSRKCPPQRFSHQNA